MPNPPPDDPGTRPRRHVRVRVQRDGPLLIEGPVDVVGEHGEVTVSKRFAVAVCTCRRSRIFPWCDTSHRRRGTPPGPAVAPDRDSHADADADSGSGFDSQQSHVPDGGAV